MDLLLVEPVTGKPRRLDRTVRRALQALEKTGLPYAVVGATALAVRGFERMTKDLDVLVLADDAAEAFQALEAAGLSPSEPFDPDDPDAMVVFTDPATGLDVDLLVAFGQPEATILEEASRARVFGVEAPVAEPEHLLLMYLYSNQPKHLGDFARIVTEGAPDLVRVERFLAEVHPEALPDLHARVAAVRNPPPAPERPGPKRRR